MAPPPPTAQRTRTFGETTPKRNKFEGAEINDLYQVENYQPGDTRAQAMRYANAGLIMGRVSKAYK